MEAANLNKKLETAVSELNEATDIPTLETSLPELRLDVINLEMSHAILGSRIKEVENLVCAVCLLLTALFFVVWTLKVQINVGRYGTIA